MEKSRLEDIVLKSVFFARYFTDSRAPRLDKCIEHSLNTFKESAGKSQERIENGRYGRLAGGMSRLIQYARKKLGSRKEEKKPIVLQTRVSQMRQEAQYFLNEIGNFYGREKGREYYAKDIHAYLVKLYSINADEAFGWLEKQQKGLFRTGNGLSIAAAALYAYSEYHYRINPELGAGIANSSAALGLMSIGSLLSAIIIYFHAAQTGRELKTVKKMYEETAKEKADLEKTTGSQLQDVMLAKKNETRIVYMKEARFTEMRRLLTNYRGFEKEMSFTEVLDHFME